MGKERTDLGFGDELESFNPSEWTPSPQKTANDRPKPEATKQAAVAAGFKSREPVQDGPAPDKPQRRRRTGRNVQFNIKARQETIDAFCAVADAKGWGLGETLEYAVALLQEHHGQDRAGGS